MMIRRVISWSGDSTKGWRLQNGMSALSIRPPARKILCSSRKGERDTNFFLLETWWLDLGAATSWGKKFFLGSVDPELSSLLYVFNQQRNNATFRFRVPTVVDRPGKVSTYSEKLCQRWILSWRKVLVLWICHHTNPGHSHFLYTNKEQSDLSPSDFSQLQAWWVRSSFL